jgi:hypothetical protein
MCRMTFAAAAALSALVVSCPLLAQQVPGRDLFQFPLGTLAEPAALATAAGGGFWNPATLAFGDTTRLLLSATALNSPIEQGVSAQLGTVAYRLHRGLTGGVQFAQASVTDLLRTDTDPQSIGGDIPYRSTIVSAVAALRRGSASLGVALRRRSGNVDDLTGHATSLDVGGSIERPFNGKIDRVSLLGAAEGLIPVRRADVRAGVAAQQDRGSGSETFFYASGRLPYFELRGGVARQSTFGTATTRMRLGLGLRYARYLVGVAREEGTAGLGATYQFMLTTVFR